MVAVHASLNKPHIAVPGKAAQEVQAYVVAVTNAGTITLFVFLWLTQTCEPVVYCDMDNLRVEAQAYPEAEADAVAFVESMGFMLENLNYRSLSQAQQAELVKGLPCFQADQPAPVQAKAQEKLDPPQLRLARFLAAF